MNSFLWRPILKGFWKQHQAFDGTYDFQDLIEINRILDWKDELEEEARQRVLRNA